MAIRITLSDTVRVKVEGSIRTDKGTDEAFDFDLLCRRLDADGLAEQAAKQSDFGEILRNVATGWDRVRDDDNQPVEFSAQGLEQLLKIPGLAQLAGNRYVRDCGAKAKN